MRHIFAYIFHIIYISFLFWEDELGLKDIIQFLFWIGFLALACSLLIAFPTHMEKENKCYRILSRRVKYNTILTILFIVVLFAGIIIDHYRTIHDFYIFVAFGEILLMLFYLFCLYIVAFLFSKYTRRCLKNKYCPKCKIIV